MYVFLQGVQGYSEQKMKIIIAETNFRLFFYRTNFLFDCMHAVGVCNDIYDIHCGNLQ